jgi:hypothetical protein
MACAIRLRAAGDLLRLPDDAVDAGLFLILGGPPGVILDLSFRHRLLLAASSLSRSVQHPLHVALQCAN